MHVIESGRRRPRLVGVFAMAVWIMAAWSGPAAGSELRVAAASALNYAMKDLGSEFERGSGIRVLPTFGASGHLLSRIQNGESYDLFFSSNLEFPRQLEAKGAAVPGSLASYALGHLVLWVPKINLDPDQKPSLELLRRSSIRKIAVPNPKYAPYGKAAVSALEHLKLYDHLKEKFLFAANVNEAAAMVESGQADAAFIALSLAVGPTMRSGEYWEVPPDAYSPVEQGAVILKASTHQAEAKSFLTFVQSEQGQAIMRRYGFLPPRADVAGK